MRGHLTFTKEDLKDVDRLERLFQQVERALEQVSKTPALPSPSQLAMSLAPSIRDQLQATGIAPLNLQSLLPAIGTAAILQDTHANRLSLYNPNNYDLGTPFYETDRSILYIVYDSSGAKVWRYMAGDMFATFANRPVDLGVNDVSFKLVVSDHLHRCHWTGTAWIILDNDAGTFIDSAVALGTGYQLCDGTATTYLTISGADLAQTAFTTPDENTAPAGVYHESIAAYTGTINAAAAPGLTGALAGEAAHTHAIDHDHPSFTSGAPSAAVDNTALGADRAATDTHTHSIDVPAFTGTSGAGSSHTHGLGTLAVDATGEPRRMGVLRYFRR
jgi:hypothetical protein